MIKNKCIMTSKAGRKTSEGLPSPIVLFLMWSIRLTPCIHRSILISVLFISLSSFLKSQLFICDSSLDLIDSLIELSFPSLLYAHHHSSTRILFLYIYLPPDISPNISFSLVLIMSRSSFNSLPCGFFLFSHMSCQYQCYFIYLLLFFNVLCRPAI